MSLIQCDLVAKHWGRVQRTTELQMVPALSRCFLSAEVAIQWPFGRSRQRARWSFRGPKRINRALHRTTGTEHEQAAYISDARFSAKSSSHSHPIAMGSLAKPHVVCIPLPAQGHLTPVIYLCKKLASEGCIVTLINIDGMHEAVKASWKDMEQGIRLESVPMVYDTQIPAGYDSKCIDEAAMFVDALTNMEQSLADVLTRINHKGPEITCVVSDFFHISAPHAVRRAGFPGVAWFPGPATWATLEYQVPQLISKGDIPVPEGDAAPVDKLIHYIPGLESIRAVDLPIYMHSSFYAQLGKERFLFRSKRIAMESWVLCNSFSELDPEVVQAMKQELGPGVEFLTVGPLFPLQADIQDPEVCLRHQDVECLDWLDQQAPGSVLYIAFGSICTLSSSEFEILADGLKASKKAFLWVIRPELVLERNDGFFKEFLLETAEQGLVISWAPQLKVLHHASTGGFLTHCGWNSIFESLSAGVPMLGWPCLYDQNTNCKLAIEDLGTGLSISREKVTKQEVQGKVTALMSDCGETRAKVVAKAKMMQVMVENAAKPGGSSYQNVRTFISAVQQKTV